LGLPGRRFALLVLPASLVLSTLTLTATPFLPTAVNAPTDVVARDVVTSVDHQRTVELPFVASHVALHWAGAPDAIVSVAFAAVEGAFGPEIPLEADAGDGPHADETYAPVQWTGGARYARITSDRPLARITVVAMQEPASVPPAAGGSVVEAAVGQHVIITRAGWGANEAYRFDSGGNQIFPPSYFPLQQFIVHHTAGRNNDPDPAATIRAIYYDHAVLRGYGDIDYNFLIDEAGRIYEGRRARTYAPGEIPTSEDVAGNLVRGSHSVGFNPGSLGVALLGTFTSQDATPAARASLTWLLAWAAERHGIDPTATHLYVNAETGAQKTLPRIAGHRDVNATACPGTVFYGTLPALRTAVKARIAASTGPAVDHAPPTVATFAPLGPASTGALSLHIGLTFSEPITGLTSSDLSVSGTSSGWSVTGIAGAAAAYTVTVSATTPTAGSVILTLAAGSVVDLAAHAGPANPAVTTIDWAPDGTAPTVVLFSTPGPSPTNATAIDVAVTFSEPVVALSSAHVTLGGTSQAATPWSVGFVYGSGASYELEVSNGAPANGTLTIRLPAGASADLAGNPSLASNSLAFVVDRTAPTSTAPVASLSSGVIMPSSSSQPARLSWTASDAGGAGLASYDLARSIDGAAFAVLATGLATPTAGVLVATGHTYRYEARARDKAGNVGGWAAGPTFQPLRYQDSSASLAYTGTWYLGQFASYSGGTVRDARVAGPTVSLTVTARSVAFVTTRDPTRGAARIYLDGVLVATVDLSGATAYRFVAYAKTWSTAATHTLKIVVVGTAGRPRVDLDAIEVLR
jgi:hypothetical protein